MDTSTQADRGLVDVLPGEGERKKPIFAVLVKRSYEIRHGEPPTRAEKTRPFVLADQYYDDDPENCTIRSEAELVPYKRGVDVVVVDGKAYAPKGRAVLEMDVSVEIGPCRKRLRVIGDRTCSFVERRPPRFSDPEEFTEMEIRYERAYGGRDDRSDPEMPFLYPRNFFGRGLAVHNVKEVIEGLSLPNIEDPEDLVTAERLVLGDVRRWNGQPLPQGIGWFQKTWYPRCSYVGSVPGNILPTDVPKEARLGLVPEDQIALARQFKLPAFDVRFNNGASPGLIATELSGDETVRLMNLTPDGRLEFPLPGDRPEIMLDIGLGKNTLETRLHTVCIRCGEMRVDLIWQGAHEYPGYDWLPEMKRLVVEVS